MTSIPINFDQYHHSATHGYDFVASGDTVTIAANVLVGSALSDGVFASAAYNHDTLINNGNIFGDIGEDWSGNSGQITNGISGQITGIVYGVKVDADVENVNKWKNYMPGWHWCNIGYRLQSRVSQQ
jgi:hypothetical protein